MICIEIRIGRAPPAIDPSRIESVPAIGSVAAAARTQTAVRIGNGSATAVLLLALAALLLGFVPASDTPQARTLASAEALPQYVAPQRESGDAARCMSAASGAQVDVQSAQLAAVPASAREAGVLAPVGDSDDADQRDANLARAISIDVSERGWLQTVASRRQPRAASDSAAGRAAEVLATAGPVSDQLAESVTAVGSAPRAPLRAEPATSTMASRIAHSDDVAAPPQFNITRGVRAESQWLQQALREAATEAMRSGDWSIVQSLRARHAFPPSLALAKWDARIALAIGIAEHAVAALAPFAAELDDEAQRLHAVALLRVGESAAALEAYRVLLRSHPEDAQLWLGLGIALEAAASDAEAIQFAYMQSIQLAQDPLIRTVARAHLHSPSA